MRVGRGMVSCWLNTELFLVLVLTPPIQDQAMAGKGRSEGIVLVDDLSWRNPNNGTGAMAVSPVWPPFSIQLLHHRGLCCLPFLPSSPDRCPLLTHTVLILRLLCPPAAVNGSFFYNSFNCLPLARQDSSDFGMNRLPAQTSLGLSNKSGSGFYYVPYEHSRSLPASPKLVLEDDGREEDTALPAPNLMQLVECKPWC